MGGINERRTVRFVFDGREYTARHGDTLVAALFAHGVRTLAYGVYTGRPRGAYGTGIAEPNAYVRVEGGEPMVGAHRVEVYEGLCAHSLSGKATLLEPETLPETTALTGPEAPPAEPDGVRRDHAWTHCDVLIVGAGPAGLAAACAAGASGARVILADDGTEPGGGLRDAPGRLDGRPAMDWVARVRADLDARPEVRILTRTAVTGGYDHGLYVAAQRRHADPAAPARPTGERLWHIRARRVVLATGGYERPVAFAGNDRPGVLLSGAAVALAHRFGVPPGRWAVVFGTHDGALYDALALHDAGVPVAAVLDARPAPGPHPVRELRARDVPVFTGHGVTATEADHDGVLAAALVAPIDAAGTPTGPARRLPCDLLAVSGGWNPATELFTHTGGRTRWSEHAVAFVPDPATHVAAPAIAPAGAATGERGLCDALADGAEAGAQAASACGFTPTDGVPPATDSVPAPGRPAALWLVEPPDGRDDEVFVDLHRDATLRDVHRARAAGLRHVEHIKRYTTIGTGVDQGRTSAVLLAGLLAQLSGTPMAEAATSTARPPVVPIDIALVAGRNRGELLDPARRTPMHAWHERHGAVFEDVGQWKRPWYYPRPGEDMADAVARECRAARESVAVLDYSTLGKIDLRGTDVAEFCDRIYANRFSTLAAGRCRYGVMCGADGMVADDGVTARLADDHFFMTTTSGNAAGVLDTLEEWLDTEWPELDVSATSVTDQWAVISLVGPRARDVLAPLAPDLDLSRDAFGFMRVREAEVAGVPARVFRVSFTGELTYEINVPARYGAAVWRAVMAAGEPYGITPYGTETMHVLRAEKGLIVAGQETDGTVTPGDAGLGWAVSAQKDFVGKRSLSRIDTAREDRGRLVGLLPVDPARRLAEGAQLVAGPDAAPPTLGHVTSAYRSATLGRTFGLGLLATGEQRHGATVYAVDADEVIEVSVTSPVFYDEEGARRDGRPA